MARERARSLAIAGVLLPLLTAGALARATDPTRASHDVAWTLHGGATLLDGGRYGVDVIDNNPPLVFWLGAGEVALARALGAPALAVHAVLVLLGALLAAVLSRRLLADGVLPADWADAVVLSLLACFVLVPGFEYGQRDHLTIVLATPYLFTAGRRLAGLATPVRTRALAGALAALGIALKPHYTLVWMGVEGLLALRLRSLGCLLVVENALIAGFGAAYVGAVALFAGDYLGSIADVRRLHGAYDAPLDWLSPAHLWWAGAAASLWLLRLPRAAERVTWMLVAAGGLALLVLHVQAKGWSYHALPAQIAALTALMVMTAAFLASPGLWDERVRWGPRRVTGAAVLTWAAVAVVSLQPPEESRRGVPALAGFIDSHARGGDVLALTSLMYPFFPAVEFSASRSASPYSCLWLVTGQYSPEERERPEFPYRRLEQMPESERRFVDNVVTALEKGPALVLIESAPIRLRDTRAPIDFRRYFSADPRFEALLTRYRRLDPIRVMDGIWRNLDVYAQDPKQHSWPGPM
jgi:hypothetical protein